VEICLGAIFVSKEFSMHTDSDKKGIRLLNLSKNFSLERLPTLDATQKCWLRKADKGPLEVYLIKNLTV